MPYQALAKQREAQRVYANECRAAWLKGQPCRRCGKFKPRSIYRLPGAPKHSWSRSGPSHQRLTVLCHDCRAQGRREMLGEQEAAARDRKNVRERARYHEPKSANPFKPGERVTWSAKGLSALQPRWPQRLGVVVGGHKYCRVLWDGIRTPVAYSWDFVARSGTQKPPKVCESPVAKASRTKALLRAGDLSPAPTPAKPPKIVWEDEPPERPRRHRHNAELTADEKRMVEENQRPMADVPPCPVHHRTRAIQTDAGFAYRCCGQPVPT